MKDQGRVMDASWAEDEIMGLLYSYLGFRSEIDIVII